MKVQMLRAPELRAELPQAASTAREDDRVPQSQLPSEELAGLPF
jgi:hypothetical protein